MLHTSVSGGIKTHRSTAVESLNTWFVSVGECFTKKAEKLTSKRSTGTVWQSLLGTFIASVICEAGCSHSNT